MVEFEVGDVAGGTVADQEEREREEARRALIEGFRNDPLREAGAGAVSWYD